MPGCYFLMGLLFHKPKASPLWVDRPPPMLSCSTIHWLQPMVVPSCGHPRGLQHPWVCPPWPLSWPLSPCASAPSHLCQPILRMYLGFVFTLTPTTPQTIPSDRNCPPIHPLLSSLSSYSLITRSQALGSLLAPSLSFPAYPERHLSIF